MNGEKVCDTQTEHLDSIHKRNRSREHLICFLCILLCKALISSASAATIYPMPSSVNLAHLEGKELPVDITWESEYEARMTIYGQDFYSKQELANVRVGDQILISGKLHNVLSANWAGDSLQINENAENCFAFFDESGTGAYTCMDGYYHTAASVIGALIIDPNIRFTCLDYLDAVYMCSRDTPLVYSNYDFFQVLKTDPTGFRMNYTYALFDANNLPQIIYRYYSAIESY